MRFLTASGINADSIKDFFSSISLEKILPSLLLLVVGLAVIRLLMSLFNKALRRSSLEPAAFGMVRSIMGAILHLILILIIVSGLGVDVTSLVAILSVVSLAISLAVQGALTNIVGGFTLLATHPFKSGDFVDIGALSGTVYEVGLAYTKLKTPDNKIISIPNGTAAAAEIVNYSTAENRRVDITVSASYDADTEVVKEALLRAANISTTLFTPAPFAGLQTYGDSSIVYVLRVWTAAENYWDTYYTINENIRKEFAAAGIEMTFPHLNVHLDK